MTERQEHIESLLGQFCYAFGAGANGVRIHSDTIRELQARYRPYLTANLDTEKGKEDWDKAKYHLLDYVRSMGRYAAALALDSGDMTILPEHFHTAAQRFESAAHRTRRRALQAGRWCPGGGPSDQRGVPQPQGELRSGSWPRVNA